MTSQEDLLLDHKAGRRALQRAALITAGSGIGSGVFMIWAWYLIREATRKLADGVDPAAVYADEGFFGSEVASLYLLPFAAILFLWFIVALRGWIRGTQNRRNLLISDVQLVSGTTFTAVFLVGAGAFAAAALAVQSDPALFEPETLKGLVGFGNTLMLVMGVRIAAIFVIATASLGLTAGVLPRWFNFAGYVFGLVLMLTPVLEPVLFIAFPTWLIALSVLLLYHLLNLRDDELPGFASRYRDAESAPRRGVVDSAD